MRTLWFSRTSQTALDMARVETAAWEIDRETECKFLIVSFESGRQIQLPDLIGEDFMDALRLHRAPVSLASSNFEDLDLISTQTSTEHPQPDRQGASWSYLRESSPGIYHFRKTA